MPYQLQLEINHKCHGIPQHTAAKLFVLTELAFSNISPQAPACLLSEGHFDLAAAASQLQRGQEDVLQAASLAQPAKL